MPYLVVDNFSAGLDSRRHVLNSKDGTLAVLKNAHITRGGEIEKRKAFSQFASLPQNTFGLETTQDAIFVFGSAPTPTMPSGVTYQRLQHPDGLAMIKVAWSTVYGGLPFVIAEFSDGKRLCFWNGTIIGDWFEGVVRTAMLNNSGIASHLASKFSLPGYTCTSLGSVLTITGPLGRSFSVTATAEAPQSVNVSNTITVQNGDPEIRSYASFDIAAFASAPPSVAKVRCHQLSGLPTVNGIYIQGSSSTGNLLNGPVNYANWNGTTENPVNWFYAIAQSINQRTSATRVACVQETQTEPSSPDQPSALFIRNVPGYGNKTEHYSRNGKGLWIEFTSNPGGAVGISQLVDTSTIVASTYNSGMWMARLRNDPWGNLDAYGNFGDSVYSPVWWEDMAVPPSFSDAPTLASFRGGVAAGVVDVKVNGTSILLSDKTANTFCPYGADIVDALVDRINNTITLATEGSATKNLGVRAYKENNKLVIRGDVGTGATSNGRTITFHTVVESSGGVPLDEASYIASYSPNTSTLFKPTSPVFTFSANPPTGTMSGGKNGVPAVSQVTTVTILGTFTPGKKITITVDDDEMVNPYIFGASRVADKNPSFSVTYKAKEYAAVGSTMYFSQLNDATRWDIYDIGSGFIDMSNNFGGREDLTGFGVYQNKLAVFSRRNVQLWFLDADPAQNQQQQILSNTGCLAPDSVVSMGAIDLLYLADNGIRSLRARENTDTAFASDIGSPVDGLVIAHMATVSEDDKYNAKGVVEPIDGRYWLSVAGKIFVLSYFPGSNINAWSIYETGLAISELATKGDRLYARAGNTIYLYGGASGNEYDGSQVVVELPYMDARKPATFKRCKGIDVTIQGEWKIYMGFDHTNPNARDLIATPNQPTFALGKIDAVGIGTHFGLRLVSDSASYSKIANVIVHYDELQAKHEAG